MQAVLFDLDGTLIDHFSAIHRACAYAGRKLGLREPGYAEVRRTVGGSVPLTLGRLFGEAQVEAARPHFYAHFHEIMLDDVAALPGAAWILGALRARGMKLAVFTNKDETPAIQVLEKLGLADHLDTVVGTGGVAMRKPQPEFTAHALAKLDAAAADCLMVGDSPFDFEAAQTHSIECHLVATGSHSASELRAGTDAAGIHPDLFALAKTVFALEQSAVGEAQ